MMSVEDLRFNDVAISKVEQFWDRRPCNIRHSTKEVGSEDYFNEVEKRKYFVEPHIPEFAQFEQWAGKTVLEIGCGIGTDTINFARHGARVTAVDLSVKSLDLARQRARVFKLEDRIDFYQGNCQDLSALIPHKKYDLLYSFGVIHHTPNPPRALRQIKAFMGPQSELRLMVYSKVSFKLFRIMKERASWDMSRIDETIAQHSEAQSGCPVTYTYTFDEARELLSDFEILELYKRHIFTWDVDHYIKHQYKKHKAWESVSDEDLLKLESELGWHMLIRARCR
jgi:2-polyprenyl-3-methyl-5-hydroxy-6-metoxy-1,4-benzoquinol methylase